MALNPSCCSVMSNNVLYPLLKMAIFALFCLLLAWLLAVCNFAQSDFKQNRREYFNQFNIFDAATVGVLLLFLLVFVLYAIFRKGPYNRTISGSRQSGWATTVQGIKVPDPSFQPVRAPQKLAKLEDKCFNLYNSKIPQFD